MFKVRNFATNILRSTTGTWQGKGRLLNKSVTPNTYSYGYSRNSLDASSPFAATKVHKCLIEAKTDIRPGHWIRDMGLETEWFVMTANKQVMNGEAAYVDATLYSVDAYFTIKRFEATVKNAFGRDDDPTLITVTPTPVPAMVNPQSFNTTEQQDKMVGTNKIRVIVQSSTGAKKLDRLENATTPGDYLVIENIDKYSLGKNGLWVLWCDEDTR